MDQEVGELEVDRDIGEGSPPSIGPHQHHYRREFDREAAEVLSSFTWYRTPLRPTDQQFVPPISE
jgi:hypothetical protein